MITALSSPSQIDFYRGFLMGRGQYDPKDFGVDLSREELMDSMVEDFSAVYRGMLTIDELLLHPREAAQFCDDVRRKHAYFDLPDDIILRSIMNRRKKG